MTSRSRQEMMRSNPRFNPLMVNNFSRLSTSTGNSTFNSTADSGYLSSFASSSDGSSLTQLLPEADLSSQQQYCSTPQPKSQVLSQTRKILMQQPTEETPITIHSTGFSRYSEDRIPRHLPTRVQASREVEQQDSSSNDILSRLIRTRTAPPFRRILQYLGEQDLLRLSEVSITFCQAVCDDQAGLKRLSRFLISVQQNAENRTTLSQNNDLPRPFGGTLRSIHNLLNVNNPASAMWTVPSPLETIDMDCVPRQLKLLISITKGLSEHQCVASCHTCRRLVPVTRTQRNKLAECSSCKQLASKNNAPVGNINASNSADSCIKSNKKKNLFLSTLR